MRSYKAQVLTGSVAVIAFINLAVPLTHAATVGLCTDADGDGWGWDGARSCPVDPVVPANECIDSPPLNDGWGWDGITSCRIPVQQSACVDSPPTGDGWGWNGVTSCPIQTSSDNLNEYERFLAYQYCEDTLPHGDGWGWTGFASCVVEANLVKNGSFRDGATHWTTYIHPDAEESSFDLSRDLRLSYRDAGSEWWHSQAYTAPIHLEGGHTYRLEFTRESGGKTGDAVGSVVVENGASFTPHMQRTDFSIGITPVRFQADFYLPVTDSNARVTFNLGDNSGGSNSLNIGTIWFTNIVLKKITSHSEMAGDKPAVESPKQKTLRHFSII